MLQLQLVWSTLFCRFSKIKNDNQFCQLLFVVTSKVCIYINLYSAVEHPCNTTVKSLTNILFQLQPFYFNLKERIFSSKKDFLWERYKQHVKANTNHSYSNYADLLVKTIHYSKLGYDLEILHICTKSPCLTTLEN